MVGHVDSWDLGQRVQSPNFPFFVFSVIEYFLKVIHKHSHVKVKEEKSPQWYLKGFMVLKGYISTLCVEVGQWMFVFSIILNAKLKNVEIIYLLIC